jgi:hypothetical protein
MMGVAAAIDDQIAQCLGRHARAVYPAGARSWEITVPDLSTARVWMDGDWLAFRARLAEHGPSAILERKLSHALRANGYLLGAAKVACCSKTGEFWLLSDVPVDSDMHEDEDLDGAVAESCAGLCQLARIMNEDGEGSPAVIVSRAKSPAAGMIGDDLAQQCQEAGWNCTTRSDGRVVIPLDVPDAFCQATIGPVEQQWIRVAVELGPLPSAGACRLAAVWFLLSASCHVRWLRPVVGDAEAREVCRWEVLLKRPAEARQLSRALAALSVACQFCLREFESLRDEAVARWFVKLQIPKREGGGAR